MTDKFDERKKELNEIKTAFNEFVDRALNLEKVIGKKFYLLSDIKLKFDRLFDLLYSTNENNRAKGYKDYSANVPDAKSKFKDEIDDAFKNRLLCDFSDDYSDNDENDKLSILKVTKHVVNNIYLKLNTYFPLIINKEILNCLYKLIDCEDSNEIEKERCDIPRNWKGDFVAILLLRDLPCIPDIISKFGYEQPFPVFFNFEYEKRFNLFVDIKIMYDLNMCQKFSNESLKMFIKKNDFLLDQAEKFGIGTKEVINNAKNFYKILSDNLEISEDTKIYNNWSKKLENIVKSTYNLKDLQSIYYLLF